MQMTRLEMIERLGNGEDELDVTINKWWRLLNDLPNCSGRYSDIGHHSDTCPLCHGNPFDCNECPLYKCGHPCLNVDDPSDENVYRKAWTALKSMRAHEFSKAQKLEAIDAMIAALHEAKVYRGESE